jgi:large subunit ribosomal protein L5
MNNLKKLYNEKVVATAMEKFGVKSPLAVPRMEKVVLNIGTGNTGDEKAIELREQTLQRITGQKPVRTTARMSISNFKIRAGMTVGLMVTLRGERMYDFVEKLINITFPRVRDFRGIRPESIDKQGNLNLGIREHNAFPEINFDEIERLHGLEISVHMTGNSRDKSEYVLRALGFPFAEAGTVAKKGSNLDNELSPKAAAEAAKQRAKEEKAKALNKE